MGFSIGVDMIRVFRLTLILVVILGVDIVTGIAMEAIHTGIQPGALNALKFRIKLEVWTAHQQVYRLQQNVHWP